MFGAIIALVISLMMIALAICKGNSVKCDKICCRKSEFDYLLRDVPDDCVIEVWIGRNTYDEFPYRKAYGRNLRNNISE